jgi:hypothetical protein
MVSTCSQIRWIVRWLREGHRTGRCKPEASGLAVVSFFEGISEFRRQPTGHPAEYQTGTWLRTWEP